MVTDAHWCSVLANDTLAVLVAVDVVVSTCRYCMNWFIFKFADWMSHIIVTLNKALALIVCFYFLDIWKIA